mmetsp:Transcript_64308/g.152163  ORF Transcript_64308/g.152163 Transcript_64308/m.152163 type:complete len:88 (-) Transcript_64308:79-342(-)
MCFKCKDCNKSLDSTNATSHEEEGVRSVYCKACYGKHFGPGGFRGGSGGTGIMAPTGADAPAPVNAGNTDADALTQAGMQRAAAQGQ